MIKLSQKIKQLFTMRRSHTISSESTDRQTAVLGEEAIARLMQALADTREMECSCDEAFAVLDEYVELVVSDEEAAALMPVIQEHLDACPGCYEKFEVLLNILQGESAVQA